MKLNLLRFVQEVFLSCLSFRQELFHLRIALGLFFTVHRSIFYSSRRKHTMTPTQQKKHLLPAVFIKYLISTYHYEHRWHGFSTAVSVLMQYYLILIYHFSCPTVNWLIFRFNATYCSPDTGGKGWVIFFLSMSVWFDVCGLNDKMGVHLRVGCPCLKVQKREWMLKLEKALFFIYNFTSTQATCSTDVL